MGLCFEGVPDDLTSPPDAFLVGVGIHSECYRRVAMAQALTDRYHVRTVGDCKRGVCVAELVGVKIIYAVPLHLFFSNTGTRRGSARERTTAAELLV